MAVKDSFAGVISAGRSGDRIVRILSWSAPDSKTVAAWSDAEKKTMVLNISGMVNKGAFPDYLFISSLDGERDNGWIIELLGSIQQKGFLIHDMDQSAGTWQTHGWGRHKI